MLVRSCTPTYTHTHVGFIIDGEYEILVTLRALRIIAPRGIKSVTDAWSVKLYIPLGYCDGGSSGECEFQQQSWELIQHLAMRINTYVNGNVVAVL